MSLKQVLYDATIGHELDELILTLSTEEKVILLLNLKKKLSKKIK